MAITQEDHIFMTQRLLGATVESAAQEAGMKVRTAYRRMSTPEFKQEYHRMVEISFLSTAGIVCGLAPRAAKKLGELLDSESERISLAAARAIQELGSKYRLEFSLNIRLEKLEQIIRHSRTPEV